VPRRDILFLNALFFNTFTQLYSDCLLAVVRNQIPPSEDKDLPPLRKSRDCEVVSANYPAPSFTTLPRLSVTSTAPEWAAKSLNCTVSSFALVFLSHYLCFTEEDIEA
jgi:hypothetical protein